MPAGSSESVNERINFTGILKFSVLFKKTSVVNDETGQSPGFLLQSLQRQVDKRVRDIMVDVFTFSVSGHHGRCLHFFGSGHHGRCMVDVFTFSVRDIMVDLHFFGSGHHGRCLRGRANNVTLGDPVVTHLVTSF